MCLNHPFSFGAMFSRKNEVDHVFEPGLVPESPKQSALQNAPNNDFSPVPKMQVLLLCVIQWRCAEPHLSPPGVWQKDVHLENRWNTSISANQIHNKNRGVYPKVWDIAGLLQGSKKKPLPRKLREKT